MMEDKLLILITAAPPFSPGEEFLNEEYKVLDQYFDKIIVIHHAEAPRKFPMPSSKFSLEFFPYLPGRNDKWRSLLGVFQPVFWQEIGELVFRYRLWPTASRMAILLGSITVGKKLRKFLLRLLADHPGHRPFIYSYWCNFMAAGLAFLKRSHPSVTCISRSHGYDLYFERSPSRYLPLRRFIYRRLERIYFISKTGLHYASQKTGLFPSFRIAFLGCREINPPSVRPEKDFLWIVSCSAALPVKRLHLIVEALQLLKSPEKKIKWTHFGDGPLLEQLKKNAEEKLHATSVAWEFKGYVDQERLLEFYRTSPVDLFINVSESEGIPFSIMEAFAAGIPAIATRVGGTHELINHGKNGFLISADPTPEEISRELEMFFSLNSSSWVRLSTEAKRTWSTGFNAVTNYHDFVKDFLPSVFSQT